MSTTERQIAIFTSQDGEASLKVQLDQDTVWLSQAQLVDLFERDVSVISRHIRNVFKDGELAQESNLQKMQIANSDRPVAFYSLDVIISVGYRVKSQRGTQFRQWATKVLRDHLVQGYTLNQQRLAEQTQKLLEMQQAVALLSRTLEQQQLVSDAGEEILQVITDYAYALATLDRYDQEGATGRSCFIALAPQATTPSPRDSSRQSSRLYVSHAKQRESQSQDNGRFPQRGDATSG
ncbi:MAG: virulence RhuM family protein [Geobacteraceae bacterium]|nr:virulence RhuM family protein [Geobacteraceae bacterium]